MNTAHWLYRSTLVSAALAIGCIGVTVAAEAHDHGWRDHDQDRSWTPRRERDWHDRGRYRGYGSGWRGGYGDHDCGASRAWRTGYPGVTLYGSLPVYGGRGWGSESSVLIRAPL